MNLDTRGVRIRRVMQMCRDDTLDYSGSMSVQIDDEFWVVPGGSLRWSPGD